MRVAHVNADPGVRPGAAKGAWVHVAAVREAFGSLGAEVVAIDEPDPERLAERLRTAGPLQLVYERFALRAHAAGDFARAADVPHVLEVNAPLDEEEARHRPSLARPVDAGALRRQLAGAHRVLCVSREVARWARQRGAPVDRLLHSGNAVDPDRFHPRRRAAGLRRRLGLEDAFVLGFHGRLRPWHGFETLVEAARRLRERGVPAHVLAVGRGDLEGALAPRLEPGAWTVVPWVPHDEVGDWVAAFDVLPLTYPADRPCYFSPLKLLEGMASGVGPLVPRLGDLPEVVDGRAGRVYPAGDLDALVEGLLELHREPAARAELAARARARAEERTWRALAARLLDLALEVVP